MMKHSFSSCYNRFASSNLFLNLLLFSFVFQILRHLPIIEKERDHLHFYGNSSANISRDSYCTLCTFIPSNISYRGLCNTLWLKELVTSRWQTSQMPAPLSRQTVDKNSAARLLTNFWRDWLQRQTLHVLLPGVSWYHVHKEKDCDSTLAFF